MARNLAQKKAPWSTMLDIICLGWIRGVVTGDTSAFDQAIQDPRVPPNWTAEVVEARYLYDRLTSLLGGHRYHSRDEIYVREYYLPALAAAVRAGFSLCERRPLDPRENLRLVDAAKLPVGATSGRARGRKELLEELYANTANRGTPSKGVSLDRHVQVLGALLQLNIPADMNYRRLDFRADHVKGGAAEGRHQSIPANIVGALVAKTPETVVKSWKVPAAVARDWVDLGPALRAIASLINLGASPRVAFDTGVQLGRMLQTESVSLRIQQLDAAAKRGLKETGEGARLAVGLMGLEANLIFENCLPLPEAELRRRLEAYIPPQHRAPERGVPSRKS